MAQSETHDVIMVGIGGRGVLVAARLFAEAAMTQYEHVSWLPSLTTAMRGGPCEATVVLSHQAIASPLVWRPQAVVAMEASQLKSFENRVKPGGLIVTESAGLPDGARRQDVRLLKFSAISIAVGLGDSQAANFVLLGAYVEVTRILSPEVVEGYMEKKFGGREKVVSINRNAFREGMKLAHTT
ncbi:MAG: 2-oxoacid:acceptor oxidoreductase family protein [Chloroflexi bacterium]|nr:2-oxoacid:acceptor oxidoreductase family protein [Chloroflexota bacterium]